MCAPSKASARDGFQLVKKSNDHLGVIFFTAAQLKLNQILNGAENPGDAFDREMNQKLMDQMMEIAPTALENMTVINR